MRSRRVGWFGCWIGSRWSRAFSGGIASSKIQTIDVICGRSDDSEIPQTYAQYEEEPREYILSSINVQARTSDLFSNPYDQVREQLRITIKGVKERRSVYGGSPGDGGPSDNGTDQGNLPSTKKS